MKFNAEILNELAYCYPGEKQDGFEVIQKEYIESGRWTEKWTQVLKFDDRYWRVGFELPATEMQEGFDPYEYIEDGDGLVEAREVFPFEEKIIVYKEKM